MTDDDDLRFVETATDDVQESLIAGRLAEAGIRCVSSRRRTRADTSAACDVYVRAADLERARAVLKEDEGGFDEAELTRLSQEAGKQNPAEP
jgi:Putative prokaryotic signal transducing protein